MALTAVAAAFAAPPAMRSCGTLATGIGWHVSATVNVPCVSARRVLREVFRRRTLHVLGYVCTKRDLADGEHIRCVDGTKVVRARSFGY